MMGGLELVAAMAHPMIGALEELLVVMVAVGVVTARLTRTMEGPVAAAMVTARLAMGGPVAAAVSV